MDWSLLNWVLGCVSIASLALFLLDRAHRAAIAQMKDSCDKDHNEMQRQIDELKKQVGTF